MPASRRRFFSQSAALVLGLPSATLRAQAAPLPSPSFQIAQRQGRSRLLTPGGQVFIPLGINHLNAALSPGGNGHKIDAPERSTRLAQMKKDFLDWHFNAVGYGAAKELWETFPFIAEASFTRCGHYLTEDKFAYDDVFDPAFQQRLRQKVATLCASTRGNPNCIGYWWTDTPCWDLARAQKIRGRTWVSTLRDLPATAPGKRRYVEFLNGPSPHTDAAFLRLIARELYTLTAAAFREHDPERLIFGERYKLGDHPTEVLEEAAKVMDVLSIQPGPQAGPLPGPGRDERAFDTVRFDALHAHTGKPVLICDHQVSFHDPAWPITLWHQFRTQAEAAESYARFLQAAFSRPYICSYFRCQYWNQYMSAPRSLLKQGLRQENGQPYAEITRRMAEINARQMKTLLAQEQHPTLSE